ncbi:TPA: glucose 1-dehydrogenase [Vibrio diabolicus]|uniref:glucose 1-dehydrogenase n=1 Tax=Vibrio diabolicus subgroup TaxID=2315253 RepID=UPI00211A37D5|nr:MULTISPECIES: glucose 1-dehydrogenase [Vibrio diabolicus subgroup]MCQ9051366.1 glucose 1-dehydrogenase [Vibrio diabolicus]MCR9548499.1 glucose 1-dehydrogenase [Vibrio antiquarius]MCS0391454.1 glucose 1-dehydrogenase [Vibrio diabolicus]MCS0455746.1 glucose 1-dehydrogenase [Vibrio diabolicus]
MNKVVIVTGASRGIGAATAKKLAEQGYAVCVNYRAQSEAAHQVVRDIQANGGKAIAVQADVSDEQQVLNLFDATENALGSVTHLVNNVGILFTQSPLAEISLERFQKVMNTNVNSCFLCCREAAKRFSTGGAIVNVSSGASRSGAPFEYVDYATSKGAMDTLTKGLSLELADRNIRVNGVRPGFIYTDMHADGGEPNRVDRLSPQIPLKRGGTVEEVANAIAWLLSNEASYVTGSFIDLSGGK